MPVLSTHSEKGVMPLLLDYTYYSENHSGFYQKVSTDEVFCERKLEHIRYLTYLSIDNERYLVLFLLLIMR